MIIELCIGALVGVALGWTVRNGMGSTRTRVLEELYTRKLRHAEQLRDEAIKTLNANKVEMAGFGERFAALDAQILSLSEARTVADEARRVSDQAFHAREDELAHWRETAAAEVQTCAEAQRRMAEAEQLSSAAASAMDQAYDEVHGLTARVASTEQLLAAAVARTVELESQLGQGDLNLVRVRDAAADLKSELALAREVLVQRDQELEQARARVAELEPLRGEVLARDATLGARAEDAARLSASLAELAPLAAALPEMRAHRDQLAVRERELEAQLATAAATASELAHLRTQFGELEQLARTTGRDLERERERSAKHESASQAHSTQARESQKEGLRLEKELQTALASLEVRQRELEQQEKKSAHELARERERCSKFEQALQARETDARESQRECARLGKELRSSEIGSEARLKEIAKRDAKLAGLEAALAERNDRIRALTPVLRPASPRGILRPQPAKRGAKSRAADDLKRIAGIGPVLAKKLQRLGVETFDQLAELTRGDLESLAEKLGIASERILREGWISSARVEARARDGS